MSETNTPPRWTQDTKDSLRSLALSWQLFGILYALGSVAAAISVVSALVIACAGGGRSEEMLVGVVAALLLGILGLVSVFVAHALLSAGTTMREALQGEPDMLNFRVATSLRHAKTYWVALTTGAAVSAAVLIGAVVLVSM